MDLLPVNTEQEQASPSQEQEIPLVGDVQARNEKLDQHLDMQSTIIKTGLDNSNPVQNYLEVKSNPDKEGQLQSEVDKKNALDIAKVDNWLKQQYATTPEELDTLVKKGKALVDEYKMEHSGPLATEQAVVDQLTPMNQPFDLRKARQLNATLRLAVANDIQKIAANQGWLDKVYENFALYLLPFGTASFPKDVKDLVGGTIFANAQQLQNFIVSFKSLPQERQLVEYPYLRDLIIKQTDSNQSNAIRILLGLLEPGSGQQLKHDLYEDSFYTAIGIPGIVSMGRSVLGATKYVAKMTNAAKMAADVGNADLAAEVATASMVDKTGVAEQASKLSAEDAQRAAIPVRFSGDVSNLEGVSPAIQRNVAEYLDKLVQTNLGLQDGSLTVREGYVTPKELSDKVYKEIDQITNLAKDIFNDTAYIDNIKITNSTSNSSLMSFDLIVDGERKVGLNKTVTATRNDITGTLDLNEVSTNKTGEYIWSPSFRYVKGELGNQSKQAARNILTSSVNQSALRSAWREANVGLSTKDLSKLDKVMMAGDTYKDANGLVGKEFTVMELRAGIDTPYGIVKLDTEKQIAAYYKNRAFMNMVANLENDELRVKLQSQGFKSTFIDGDMHMIKPYESATAQAEITKGNVKRIYDIDESKIITVGSDKEALAEKLKGKILVKLYEDVQVDKAQVEGLQEGEHIRYALIDRTAIKELPQEVLKTKPGYVPALYKNEEYFVKQKMQYIANDEQTYRDVTLRRFASKKQAEAFANSLNLKAALEGKWDKKPQTAPYRALSDRELTVEQLLGDSSISGRSMVFGRRSTREIPFGLQGTDPERISSLEAFDRNIRQLSKLMAYNASRIRSEQMWVNTAKEYGFDIQSFNQDLPLGSKVTDQLMALKHQIKAWNMIPTKEERLWSQIWQSVHDWMVEGSYSVGVPKDSFSSILWLKHSDPIRAARSAAFHVLLGLLNPAQIVVQSSQAAIAASLNPTNAVRAFKYANALRAVDLMQDERAMLANIQKLREHPDFADIKDVDELAKLWQRSGFGFASHINNNYEMATDVAGFTNNTLNKILDNSQFFYKEGVSFANRFSFANAYIEYKKLNPGIVTDKGLNEIIARADRDTFHMLSSDKAPLYKGGFSIPLQFSQIIMKSVEAMFGKEFTWGQKARILGGQLALYGMAGYNLNKAFDMAMRKFGTDPSQIQEGWRKDLYKFGTGGSVELLPLLLFGTDLDISNRVAILNGAGQWAVDTVLDDRPLWQKALGATGTVAGKIGRTMGKLSTIALGGIGDEPMTKGDIILGLQEILKVPSSSNNVLTAIYMSRFGQILDKNGIPIIDKNFSTAEVIAQAVGFKPSAISQTYELMRYNTLKDKQIDEIATSLLYFLNQYTGLYANPDNKELAINTRKAIQVHLNPFNPMERAQILDRLKSKIEHPKTKLEKAVNEFIKTTANDLVNAALEDKKEALDNGIITEEKGNG